MCMCARARARVCYTHLDVEAPVDLLELTAAHVADLAPRVAGRAVATLQPHHLLVRALLEVLVLVEELLRVLVELLQVGDRRRLGGVVGEDRLVRAGRA